MDKDLIPCFEQAVRFLSIREHNVSEMKMKLKQKGYDSYIIDRTVSELENQNCLSEERYIRSFVLSGNRRHPEGKSIILARLSQKGADRELSKLLVNEIYTPDYSMSLLGRAYEKLKKGQKTAEVKMKLLRLGFSSAEINAFLAEKEPEN